MEVSLVPTLSKEQLVEIEVEMTELIDENSALREEIETLKVQLNEMVRDRSMVPAE